MLASGELCHFIMYGMDCGAGTSTPQWHYMEVYLGSLEITYIYIDRGVIDTLVARAKLSHFHKQTGKEVLQGKMRFGIFA